MNTELFLIEKHTDTVNEQTKLKPQEKPEFELNKQMDTFSFNTPINFAGKGKWLLAITYFEATTSVLNKIVEHKNFSISLPDYWMAIGAQATVNASNETTELRSENDIKLHVKEVEKIGKIAQIASLVGVVFEYNLSNFDI